MKGIVFGVIAAMLYGMIPIFFVPISKENPHVAAGVGQSEMTILFYRFLFASLGMAVLMLWQRISFRISLRQLPVLFVLSFLAAITALLLAAGYKYMNSGMATTIHFMYPVCTAILMMLFYHEHKRKSTLVAICLSVVGVGVLSWQPSASMSVRGIVVELLSAVTFALYLIRLNRARLALMHPFKLVFYILFLGTLTFGMYAMVFTGLEPIHSVKNSMYLLGLGWVSTALPNIFLLKAVRLVGSTTTSILGVFEPLSAVALGCWILGEELNWQMGVALLFIIPSVVIIIYNQNYRGNKSVSRV